MSNVQVKLFKAKWCGHCKEFIPEWEQLKNEAKDLKIETIEIDADDNNAKEEMAKESVQGFPTIKIYANGNGQEYSGPRNANAILNECLKLKNTNRPTLGGGGRSILRGGGRSILRGGADNSVTVKLFKAEWCGHCRNYKNAWADLKNKCSSLGIQTVEYDADNDKEIMAQEGIKGFPTLKLEANGKSTELKSRDPNYVLEEAKQAKQNGGISSSEQTGGGNYYHQYRKYKAKYLRMKGGY